MTIWYFFLSREKRWNEDLSPPTKGLLSAESQRSTAIHEWIYGPYAGEAPRQYVVHVNERDFL